MNIDFYIHTQLLIIQKSGFDKRNIQCINDSFNKRLILHSHFHIQIFIFFFSVSGDIRDIREKRMKSKYHIHLELCSIKIQRKYILT